MDDKSATHRAPYTDTERLISIIDDSPTIAFVWELTEGWPVAFVSKAIENFGYTVDEFLSRSIDFEEIVHPDDLQRVGQEVEQAINSDAVKLEQKYRIVTRSGETRWIMDWTDIIRDKSGRALQAQGIILDITDFVNAEARARDFANFPLENPYPLLRIDCFGDILLTNKAAQKLIADLTDASPAQRENWKKMLSVATDMQLSGRFDLDVGDKRYEFNIQHVEGKDYTNLYGEDVTDRHRDANRLLDIAENLPGAFFQYKLNPDNTDEIIFLNKRCEEIWDVTTDQVARDSSLVWNKVHPDDIEGLRTSVMASAHTASAWEHEWRIFTPSGEKKWLRGFARPRSQQGGASIWNALVFDVTVEKKSAQALSDALKQAIRVLSAALEARDPYTAGHEQRVAEVSIQIGQKMGLSSECLTGLELAATIHDVGKIQIPAEILSKPTKLSPEEYALIKAHPAVGAKLLSDIEFEWPIAEIIHQHHERFDGSGYPDGLAGTEILLEARIIAVADTLEAMASHRPYRPGLGIKKAAEEIRTGAGTRYDPEIAEVCLGLIENGEIHL
ncbi:PAS domain-containing protein [Thalassospiraceae bacterium LMO-JJ14]|nr:PAS domain-containing protein [Thalassospiraceae bacterium LMO-JJ14]